MNILPLRSPDSRWIRRWVFLGLFVLALSGGMSGAVVADEYENEEWETHYEGDPEWVPPPPPDGADDHFTIYSYAPLWNGMEHYDRNLDDIDDSSVTDDELAIKLTPFVSDNYTRPLKDPILWNRYMDETFAGGGTSTSIHPPDMDTDSEGSIKDAYIDIAAATPSTRTYLGNNETVHYLPGEKGTLLVASDYRTAIPSTDRRGSTRSLFSFEGTSASEIRVKADGEDITAETTSSTGGSEVNYTDLPADETQLSVSQTFEIEYEETIQSRECNLWEDQENKTGECLNHIWETDDTELHSERMAVEDTITVEQYSPPTPKVRVIDASDSTEIHYEVVTDGPWTQLYLNGVGHLEGSHDFYTKRNTEYDTLVKSTASGESDPYRAEFTPIETYAYPARQTPIFVAEVRSNLVVGEVIDSDNAFAIDAATIDPNIGVQAATDPSLSGKYRYPETTRVRTNLNAEQFETEGGSLESMVYGDDAKEINITDRRQIKKLLLTLELERVSPEDDTLYDLTITVVEAESGDPVDTEDHPGYLLSTTGHYLNTGPSGQVTQRVSIETDEVVTVRYISPSLSWVENDYHSAEESIRSPTIPPLWESIKSFAENVVYPFSVLTMAILFLVATMRLGLGKPLLPRRY